MEGAVCLRATVWLRGKWLPRFFVLMVLVSAVLPTVSWGQADPPAVDTIGALLIIPTGGRIGAAQFTGGDGRVAVWDAADTIALYARADGMREATYNLAAPMDGLAWGLAGRVAVWAGDQWWIFTDWGATQQLNGIAPSPINGALWGDDGRWLLTYHPDGRLIVWDTQEGSILHQTQWRYGIDVATLDADSRRVLLGSWAGAATVYDLMAQAFVADYDHQTRALVSGVFAASGVMTWGWDGSVRWPGPSSAQVLDLGAPIWDVTVATNQVFVRLSDGRVAVIDGVGRSLAGYWAHDAVVTALVVRSNRALTTSADGLGRLWDLDTGHEILRFAHPGSVWGGAWSVDGAAVLTWDADGAIWVFPVLQDAECYITAPNNVNTRDLPSTSGAFMGTLAANTGRFAVDQTRADDGYTWYQLDNGAWVRGDVVAVVGCP